MCIALAVVTTCILVLTLSEGGARGDPVAAKALMAAPAAEDWEQAAAQLEDLQLDATAAASDGVSGEAHVG